MKVDFELRGCPINKAQLLEVLAAELQGRKPRIPSHSVCVECKRRGNVCVTVAHGTPCLGPVTQAGCGALCPSFDRGCYGCFGPQDTPNTASIAARLRTHGMSEPEVMRVFRTFNAASEAFLRESERHERVHRGGGAVNHKLTDGGHVLHVGTLARVEGEGAMHIEFRDGKVTDVQLSIFEPPRFYEAFLRGRSYTEPPDITARICGICPVAYQMSACWAIEDACGVTVPEEIRLMRRLLYCGEWIESHALHVFLLHAPDFLGYDGAIEMAADHPAVVERGLRMKRAGNQLMTLVGGRSIHPINVRIGGFYRMPDLAELRAFRPVLEQALEDALETVAAGGRLRLPRLRAALRVRLAPRRGGLPDRDRQRGHVLGRRVRGPRLPGAHRGVPGRALQRAARQPRRGRPRDRTSSVRWRGTRSTTTGSRPWPSRPPARPAWAPPAATRSARSSCGRWSSSRPTTRRCGSSTAGRGARPRASRSRLGRGKGSAPARHRAGCCSTATCSTTTGSSGTRRSCRPRRRTNPASRRTSGPWSKAWADLDDHALQHRCEHAIRNYDPCISCATHFLDLTVDRA